MKEEHMKRVEEAVKAMNEVGRKIEQNGWSTAYQQME